MTARLAFTQHGLRRAIQAARKEGLHVWGIRPDGTLVLGETPPPDVPLMPAGRQNAPSPYEDVEA